MPAYDPKRRDILSHLFGLSRVIGLIGNIKVGNWPHTASDPIFNIVGVTCDD